MADLPIKFEDKIKAAPSGGGTGYPYRISATDLDKNFAYAALDAEDGWIDKASVGAHPGRKLKLPTIPVGGTQLLASVDNALGWIKTKEVQLKYIKDNLPETGVFLMVESES